ncbi:hypothetical protein NO055_24575 [Escherichia coli]|uniref:hypothetical protein n=2 Tax=Escherichia TaxID=561 RepID=UPI001C5CF626|nr:hypothetical protein [Escherichia coli]MCR1252199.1 hypothetical protein [Escherichia coli]MCR1295031.1 hypothetical protein [Escherichia coli]HDC8877511.1 hypothetical protein [Escherichia coli]
MKTTSKVLTTDTNLVITNGVTPSVWFKRAEEISARDVVKVIFSVGGSKANYNNVLKLADEHEFKISSHARTWLHNCKIIKSVIAFRSVRIENTEGFMIVTNNNKAIVFGSFLKTNRDEGRVYWQKGAFVLELKEVDNVLIMDRVSNVDVDAFFKQNAFNVLPDYQGVKPTKEVKKSVSKPTHVPNRNVVVTGTAAEIQAKLQFLNKDFYIKKGELSTCDNYYEAVARYAELVDMEKELLNIRDQYALVNPTYAKTRKPAQPLGKFEDYCKLTKPEVKPRPTLRIVA